VATLKPHSRHRLTDTLMGLDTPTLKGGWELGPYLHDGSAADLMEVVTFRLKSLNFGKSRGIEHSAHVHLGPPFSGSPSPGFEGGDFVFNPAHLAIMAFTEPAPSGAGHNAMRRSDLPRFPPLRLG
jgi:hypothetical protein